MGLDITVVEYKGKDEKGYLIMKCPKEDLPYSTERYAIRKQILNNIDFETLSSDKYYDMEEYYRPSDFEQAYKWANTIDEDRGRQYLIDLFDSLKQNDNYYLDYG